MICYTIVFYSVYLNIPLKYTLLRIEPYTRVRILNITDHVTFMVASVAAVDRLEEVTDGQLTGIDSGGHGRRLEIAVTSPYGHDHGQTVLNLSGTVTVSFGPSKTASSYLAVTADGLSRSKSNLHACITVLAPYITPHACTACSLQFAHRYVYRYRCGFVLIP